ncbi:tetratricopeptide repeat protein [soil metagenome]
MMARLVGIILGVILATSGYVIAGWGVLGDWAQHLDLGPFEPHRPFVGWAAAITGALLLVAALTPRPKPRSRRKTVTVDLGFAAPRAAPVLSITPVVEAEPVSVVETPAQSAAPVRVSAPDPAPAPVAAPGVMIAADAPIAAVSAETFTDLRAKLIALSRTETWPEAARVLSRLLRVANSDREKAQAHCDLGDFARGQGRLDEAAEAYDEAVSFARSARAAQPPTPLGDFADDDLLAGALSGVGDVAEMEGRLNEALSAFEEALALRRTRGGREAADAGAKRALSVSLERLADLREDRGHRMRALDLYRESYDVAARLAAADPARFGADLASTRARLAELEAKISG